MNKLTIILVFIAMVLAQWFVPGNMIFQQEKVLTEGTPYKFKTRPIDPTDPLRGKYISLRYEIDKAKFSNDSISYGEDIYIYLDTGVDGFAKVTHASLTKLRNNQDFLKVRNTGVYNDSVYFEFPFTTFYMEESKAYDAEVFVREANRDQDLENCYGLVYIKDGVAVLEDVIVNDMPIKNYVEKHQKENTFE